MRKFMVSYKSGMTGGYYEKEMTGSELAKLYGFSLSARSCLLMEGWCVAESGRNIRENIMCFMFIGMETLNRMNTNGMSIRRWKL